MSLPLSQSSLARPGITPLAWMVAAGTACWMLVAAAVGRDGAAAALFGMLGPLVSASAAWVMMDRVHRTAPERLMNVMIKAFAVKMLFFAAYVVAMLRVVDVQPIPFAASFAVSFIALHMMEAVFLRRLLTDTPGAPRN